MATITGNGLLYGGTADDTITANSGSGYGDWLIGHAGSDILSGGDGNDTLAPDANYYLAWYGYPYNYSYLDSYYDDGAIDSVDGGEGYDVAILRFDNQTAALTADLSDSSITVTIAGTSIVNVEQFQIVLGSGNDNLTLGAGHDYVIGNAGDDTINGGDGNDQLYGGIGNDTLSAGAGSYNYLYGEAGNDTLTGGDGNDQIYGGADDDTLIGGAGNDYFDPGTGNDTINGGDDIDFARLDFSGADAGLSFALSDDPTIATSVGTKTLSSIEGAEIRGTAYADTITGGSSGDTIYGNAGNDTLNGAGGYDTIFGGDGADTIDGGGDGDQLLGDGGDDTLTPGGGSYAYVYGGDGNDTIVLAGNRSDYTFGAAGDGRIFATDQRDGSYVYIDMVETFQFADQTVAVGDVMSFTFNGSAYGDYLPGTYHNDELNGGDGNDTLLGFAGNDVLNGEAGDDWLDPGLGDDMVNGGDGSDRTWLNFANSASGVTYTLGDGVVVTSSGTKTLSSIEGADIAGSQYSDTITGGSAHDYLYGNGGNDVLNGGGGDDYLEGGAGADTLNGGDGNDTLYDNYYDSTADTLNGGAGDDYLNGGYGDDTLNGGDGTDRTSLNFQSLGSGVIYTLGDGAVVTGYGTKTLTSIEAADIVGSQYDDTITGSSGNDSLNGYYGNDVLNGGGGIDSLSGYDGDDTLNGGDGDDYLNGDAGADTLNGGDGNDNLYGGYDHFSGVGDTLNGDAGDDWLDGGDGNDSLNGGAGTDRTSLTFTNMGSAITYTLGDGAVTTSNGTKTLTSIEGADITGSQYDDTITGGSAHDSLNGYFGNDVLNGGDGNDTLEGYAGNDQLNGGAGDDILYGNWDNDTLTGGAGDDTLYGNGYSALATYSGPVSQYEFTQNTNGSVTVTDTGGVEGSDTLWNIASLQFSDGTFSMAQLVAAPAAPVISSNGGADSAGIGVDENTTGVTTVVASDANPGDAVVYSITGGDDAALFQINASTGVLTFVNAPDNEAPADTDGDNVYEVVVSAGDGNSSDQQALSVTVQDTIDSGELTGPVYPAPEGNSFSGSGSTGRDGGQTRTYSGFSTGVDNIYWGLDSIKAAMDGAADSAGENLTFAGISADGLTATWIGTTTAPGYGGTVYTKLVVTINSATSGDAHWILSDSLGYSTGPVALVDVDESVGTLTVNVSYQASTSLNGTYDSFLDLYDGITTAGSGAVTSSSGLFYAHVLNQPPSAPIDADGDSGASVAESLAVGSAIGISAQATDPDGDTLTYYFKDGDGHAVQTLGNFTIDASTGVVTLASALDYETATSHTLTVYASDGVEESHSDFTVNVVNVDESANANLSVTGTAEEGGSLTASLTDVSDPDGDVTGTSFQWQMLVDGNWTDIAGASSATLNIPDDQSYVGAQVRVVATIDDAAGGSTSFTGNAQTVANVNDAPGAPIDTDGDAGATVAETLSVGSVVGITAQSSDADGDALTYFFKDGDGNAVQTLGNFTIDASTGVVTLASALDYETATSHSLTVYASDGAAESSTGFTVNVVNIDESASANFSVSGTAQEGGSLTASLTDVSDPDGGIAGTSFQWQMLVDGEWTDIAGENSATLNVPGDQSYVGADVRVVATIDDTAGGSTSFTSDPQTIANVDDEASGTLTLSGSAQEGGSLSTSFIASDADGSFDSVDYQWQVFVAGAGTDSVNGVGGTWTNIAGETTGLFNIPADQSYVGMTVRAVVTTLDVLGGTTVFNSAPETIANVNDAPTGTVTISGTAAEDAVLTASNTLADEDGLGTVSYQWLRDGQAIGGATGSTYTQAQADVGHVISVSASYTDGQGGSESVTSDPTGTVANVEDEATGTLGVTGSAQEGGSLAASLTGVLDEDGATSTSYHWQIFVGGTWSDISGANGATLNIPSDQSYVGQQVRVVAITTDALGGTTQFTSAGQTIANVNDAPGAPSDTDGTSGATVAENLAIGGNVGIDANATDPDGDTLAYYFKVGSGDAVQTLGHFTIDAATGVVTLATALDYETATGFSLTIYASDGIAESSSGFTVNVSNVVEHPFTESGDGSLASPVDFNAMPNGAYDFDTSRYSALGGDDYVRLPNLGSVDAGNPWDYSQAFNGGAGNDLIQGSDQADRINGDDGTDRLFGGAGADVLNGGAGLDALIGGAGADRLTGGAGTDVFIFTTSEIDTTKAGPHDVVTDFVQGQDYLDISALYSGHAVSSVTPGKAGDAAKLGGYKVEFYTEGGKTYVIGDTDGKAGADFTIELTGTFKLKAADFITSSSGWPTTTDGYDYASLHRDAFWS